MSIFLLFFIAVFYKKRFEKPVIYSILIFLLFNTNIHSFFSAFILMIIYIIEVINLNSEKKKDFIIP